MLLSLALIILLGLTLAIIMEKLKLPRLLGMIIAGILLGPYAFNLISTEILNISADLRQISLIVILIRAGLTLNVTDLKRVGRPAVLMCFVPATIEMLSIIIFAQLLFNISYLEAAILGAVLAAVSPAVVVPRMITLIENGYGKQKSVPQLVLAGASVDDVYVIVIFTSFLNMYQVGNFDIINIIRIPISISVGILIGVITGSILVKIFRRFHMRDTVKILLLFSISFFLILLEDFIKPYISMSALLSIMAIGITILKKHEILAKRLSNKYSKIWVGAELILFVLVGASVDITYLKNIGITAIFLIFISLFFRIAGVFICLIKTNFNLKERLFCAISYLPKATVQAAIGGIPLAMGVEAGNMILTIAVLSIIITAPFGAFLIDNTYKRLLVED